MRSVCRALSCYYEADVYVCVCVQARVHLCMYMCMHMYVHVCMFMRMHMCTVYMSVHM